MYTRRSSIPITALLFDLDGTLADSRPGILASIDAALRDLGHEPDRSLDVSFLLGPPIDTTMERLLAHYGDHRTDRALKVYRDHQEKAGIFQSRLYPAVTDSILALRQRGVRTYVATSKRLKMAKQKLAHLKVDCLFEEIYGSLPGGALNDKTDLIAHVLTDTRLDPATTAMVGDRKFDMIGARANGLHAIGALWGYGSEQELASAGAQAIVLEPSHLVKAISAID